MTHETIGVEETIWGNLSNGQDSELVMHLISYQDTPTLFSCPCQYLGYVTKPIDYRECLLAKSTCFPILIILGQYIGFSLFALLCFTCLNLQLFLSIS